MKPYTDYAPGVCDVCGGEAPPDPMLIRSAADPDKAMELVVCGPCDGDAAARWVADHLEPMPPVVWRSEDCRSCGAPSCSCRRDVHRDDIDELWGRRAS